MTNSECLLCGSYLAALARFTHRLCYAPLINDDIVSFESCWITGESTAEVFCHETHNLDKLSIVLEIESNPSEFTGDIKIPDFLRLPEDFSGADFDPNDLIGTDGYSREAVLHHQKRICDVIRGLMSLKWSRVIVNADHKTIATLYSNNVGIDLDGIQKDQSAISETYVEQHPRGLVQHLVKYLS